MIRIERTEYLPILIIFCSFSAIIFYGRIFTMNTIAMGLLNTSIIACVLWNKKLYFAPDNWKDYRIVQFYFVWMIIGVVRGIFVAENYWEGKQLFEGSVALSLPIFVYVFSIPEILKNTLRLWIKIALPMFILFILVSDRESYHCYLGPVLLLSCFLPIIPKKWIYIFLSLLFLMMVVDLGARSQVIKSAVALLISAAYLLSKFFSPRLLHIVHWICYIVPIILLYLGITGIFNPFQALSDGADGKYTQESKIAGIEGEEDIAADTRTFIYVEVIESAVRHQYIWHGRTPARGNDSWTFGAFSAEELQTGKYERHANELCHPNVFTWLGLIGTVLYSLIYLKSSYLALYKSNNIWIKLLGVFIAFRWAFGWIEDDNLFNIMNIAIWMMIAMGFSEQFRKMSDLEFKNWVLKIFEK